MYFADANSQLGVLRMVAAKQAEIGILEAPVIGCNKMAVIGAEFLQILTSLGPLPPYRIMINKALSNNISLSALETFEIPILTLERFCEIVLSFL